MKSISRLTHKFYLFIFIVFIIQLCSCSMNYRLYKSANYQRVHSYYPRSYYLFDSTKFDNNPILFVPPSGRILSIDDKKVKVEGFTNIFLPVGKHIIEFEYDWTNRVYDKRENTNSRPTVFGTEYTQKVYYHDVSGTSHHRFSLDFKEKRYYTISSNTIIDRKEEEKKNGLELLIWSGLLVGLLILVL